MLAVEVKGLEPSNPEVGCERFIKKEDQNNCLAKSKQLNLDWYAASVCNMVEDDDQLMKCWNEIAGHSYAPKSLEKCSLKDSTDDERIQCLRLVTINQKNTKGRVPASASK